MGVLEEEGELVLGAVDQADVVVVGAALAYVEVDGFGRAGGELEAVGGGGGFGGCGGWFAVAVDVVEGPALTDGVLDDDGAGIGGGVADVVGALGDVGGGLGEDALGDFKVGGAAGVAGVGDRDADGLVGGVGEEAALVGVDGVEEAFAAEVAVFDDGEGAAVEGEGGGVGDPEGAQGGGVAAGTITSRARWGAWSGGWGRGRTRFCGW